MDQEVKKELAKLRGKIDQLDEEIVKLLNERAQVVLDIKELKKKQGLPVYDPQREEEIFKKIAQTSNGPLDENTLRLIYQKILEYLKTFE